MSSTRERPGIIGDADAAYEAIRAINHATIWPGAIPAPVVYRVLGNLASALGYGAEQALGQLADRLTESLSEYELTEDDASRNPADSIAEASANLREAARFATRVGEHLGAAQEAIAGQGHRGRLPASATN